ncbi:NAD(P)H-hydrate dehydratase [Lactobacillus xylocopicola]|uniref:ADP-dependent (S)-NAD(P)H-hydrate dehydratase n=1 Tax=Lactobacillus xylocopicola TaxID=2976676 RepID=A0ABN6SKE9_9LACO|nr:NAD(P)H-hydrate dehydratase [Lactobacillus xylocopicola]BDR60775.1 ADP-dependent (S)-NAD(P)H-hydrate dehydratase [Lactobacillus xylocopicola]
MDEISPEILQQVIKKRASNTHKGDYGRVLLIGGSENYGGAIIMATEGAINCGAGLVAVATHSLNAAALHARNPEAMYIDWRDHGLSKLIKQMDVIVCGPGLGTSPFAQKILKMLGQTITPEQTLVLDASALDLLALDNTLLPSTAVRIILTPHQMEWQRLSQIQIPYQSASANAAALAKLFPDHNAILVLKSNHTQIYDPDGQVSVNPGGNPGMAMGGMGDTLAGIIGGLVAQFGSDLATVQAAVYLHSLAGDLLAQTDYTVRPTKVSALLPKLMKKYGGY